MKTNEFYVNPTEVFGGSLSYYNYPILKIISHV